MNGREDCRGRSPDAFRRARRLGQPGPSRRAITTAANSSVELAVLPELFNTGYSLCPDFGPYSETAEGPTLVICGSAAVSGGWRSRLVLLSVKDDISTIRWFSAVLTGTFRFTASAIWCSGSGFDFIRADLRWLFETPWGRVGFAICADMIYRRVWSDYRGRIDLAVVSAAWPDFADRESGRRHWLLGHVGPLSGAIPPKVAMDLDVPVVFANQCGVTHTTIPVLGTKIKDRFSGQSSICDGRHGVPVEPIVSLRSSLLLLPSITSED